MLTADLLGILSFEALILALSSAASYVLYTAHFNHKEIQEARNIATITERLKWHEKSTKDKGDE
jgi:hypothetical protein